MDNSYKISNLEDITEILLIEVIEKIISEGHLQFAPLGCCSRDYLIFGQNKTQEISIRLHSGLLKLFITDQYGNLLFNGGYNSKLFPISFISTEFYNIIHKIKYLLPNNKCSKALSEIDKEQMICCANKMTGLKQI